MNSYPALVLCCNTLATSTLIKLLVTILKIFRKTHFSKNKFFVKEFFKKLLEFLFYFFDMESSNLINYLTDMHHRSCSCTMAFKKATYIIIISFLIHPSPQVGFFLSTKENKQTHKCRFLQEKIGNSTITQKFEI